MPKIDIENINPTNHFNIKYQQRKSKIGLDINNVYEKIINETPVSIIQQDKNKFKLQYKLTTKNDLSIIISVKKQNPFTIILVTIYMETIIRRMK
jgi:hypothetical protein